MQRTLRRFGPAYDQIRSADLLLFRPQWWALHSKLICVAGRTDYCHAGMVGCLDPRSYDAAGAVI